MGNFFFFAGATAPPSHYVAPPLPLEVLFKLDRLGLWPNDLVRGRRHIRGRSTKVEMEIALQEELKGIYSRPKPIQGGLKHLNPLNILF